MTDPSAHLLIVDDDERIRGLLQKFLMRNGFLATVARDAAHARRLVDGLEFDLLVLDVMMPGMSGWEVCRAVREDEALADTKVIMLTGIGERLNEMTSPLYGADAFLDKPFDLDDLSDRVEELIGVRPG